MELSWSEKSEYIGIVGRRGENETRILTFDCTSALQEYPEAEILCIMQRPGDAQPYTHDYTQDGNTITVALASADMCRVGTFKLELRLMQDEKILKSAIYRGGIALSLHYGEPECGEAVDLLNRIDKTLKDATETAARLETSLDGVDDAIDRLDAATDSATTTDKQAQENEKTRGEAEKERVEAENGRILAENSRQQQENERADAEFIRSNNERLRYGNENQRIINESERTQAENARKTAESSRAVSENTRVQAESERVKAETSRAEAEQSRIASEETRVSAEKSRTKAEALRVQAEQRRETAETARAEAERQRKSMETSRQTAETARNTAESGRVTAEKARVSAEAQRKQAETARADAEGKRVQAEQGRVTAEQGRVEAETKREETMAQHAEKIAELEKKVANKAQIDDTTVSDTEAWSSQHIVDMLCPPLEENGNPIVCYPVAGSKLGVKASWEPTQEGTGTPYPAGGGKNLFRLYDKDTTVSANGLMAKFDLKAETITVTGTSTKTDDAWIIINQKTGLQIPDFAIGETYTLSWTNIAGMYAQIVYTNTSGGLQALCYLDSKAVSFTVPNDYASFFTFQVGVNKTAGTVSGATKIQLEKGSIATAYAPYANIRPIHGRTQVKVERCGENLLPFSERIADDYPRQIMASDALLLLSKVYAGQEVTLTFSVETQNIVFNDSVEDEWGKRIGFECHGILADGTETYMLQCWLDDRDGELTKNGKKTKTVTITMPELVNGNIMFYAQNIKSGSFVAYDFGIYAGTTSPAIYSPYTGSTTTLTLPSTIYGGEVDAVTGEGLWAWRLIALDGTENWKRDSSGGEAFICNVNGIENRAENSKMVCSHAAWGTASPFANYRVNTIAYTLYLVWPNADGDAVKLRELLAAQYAAGTPVQVAYKIATPVPFTATGGGTIKALSGTNTILTDADALTVTGRADPIHIIQQLQAASSTSAQALADVERAVTDI